MIRLFALLAGVVLFSSAASASGHLSSIPQSKDRHSPVYMLERCNDFANAVTVYSIILGHNPVYGTDHTRRAPFKWTVSFLSTMSELEDALGTGRLNRHPDMINTYLGLFGPVSVPTLVPNRHLYQADKAACIAAFGKSV